MSMPIEFNAGQRWLQQVRDGDETIWLRAYRKLLPAIRKLLKLTGGDTAQADDLLQDAMLAMYEKIMDGKLTELRCEPETFLYSVAKNKWKEQARRTGKMIEMTRDAYPYIELSEEWTTDAEAIDTDEILQNAIARLDEKCRNILQATLYSQTNMGQVADALGYGSAHVLSNLKYRCMEKLKTIAQTLVPQTN